MNDHLTRRVNNDAKQLRDLAKATLELLKGIEWSGDSHGLDVRCPRCDEGGYQDTKEDTMHAPDCGLKFLIDTCDEIIKAPWQVPVAGRVVDE